MTVSSPPGGGTVLSITLPIEPSATPVSESRAAVTSGLLE